MSNFVQTQVHSDHGGLPFISKNAVQFQEHLRLSQRTNSLCYRTKHLCLIQLIILRCGLQLPRWSPNSFKTYMKLFCFPSQAYMPNQTKHESTKVTRTKEHALFSRFASLPCSLRHQGNSCILHKVHGNFLLSYNASTEIQTTES